MIVHMGRQVGCMRRNRISRTAGGVKVKFAYTRPPVVKLRACSQKPSRVGVEKTGVTRTTVVRRVVFSMISRSDGRTRGMENKPGSGLVDRFIGNGYLDRGENFELR